MALRLREWRKRKRDLSLLLCYSDILQDINLLNNTGTQYAGTSPQCKDLSTLRSRHAVHSCASEEIQDGYRKRSCSGCSIRSRRLDNSFRSRSRPRDHASRSVSRSRDHTSRSMSRSRDHASRSRDHASRSVSRSQDHASTLVSRSRGHTSRSVSRSWDHASRSTSRSWDHASKSVSSSQDHASRSTSRSRDHTSRLVSRSRDHASKSVSSSRDHTSRSVFRPRDYASRSRSRDHASRSVSRDHTSRSRPQDHASRSRSCDLASKSEFKCDDYTFRSDNESWALPLPENVFQHKVLNLLIEIRNNMKHMQPPSSAVHIERMETMEDFDREEERLCNSQTFDTLVLQISRIGGRNTKDFVHKVLDRLFTNALMAKFNMKGKGKQGKRPLEMTKVYSAIKEGIMNGDVAATEDFIRTHAAEHLKHAPQRSGGHGH